MNVPGLSEDRHNKADRFRLRLKKKRPGKRSVGRRPADGRISYTFF